MGSLCDFCGEQRAIIYCGSDAASLCLSCDRNVHSANALSRRHSRTPLCDGCCSQPATVRCIEESISLCQNCEWNEHGSCPASSAHKREKISCYSGCPSAMELAGIWSFAGEFTRTDSVGEQGLGLMSINENIASTFWGTQHQSSNEDIEDICRVNHLKNVNAANVHDESSSTAIVASLRSIADQLAGSIDLPTHKPEVRNGEEDFYDDFVVDAELTFENYEELFVESHTHSENLFEDVGMDSFFEMKENSVVNSNYQSEFVAEATSAGQPKSMKAAGSNAVSSDSMMSNQEAKADSSMSIHGRQAHSNLSLTFSSLTGESSASDYQDSGMSSMPFMCEPPWFPTGPENLIQTANRDIAVMRYKQKKKERKQVEELRVLQREIKLVLAIDLGFVFCIMPPKDAAKSGLDHSPSWARDHPARLGVSFPFKDSLFRKA
ncbi:Zinc finger protein CONSTANS-LIKE 10 [Platanthera guangdongensis]|uniref:Zinc finger protein CONSTANS-LIKE 10 n=1 Tax=Platanthera guangdongensis TaxID=2320717 RepID=A0ABR2N282_9ASPA